MAWQDRLKEAAYTSPGGTRITFAYEDVSENVEKQTTAFEFPDAEGTLIQDLGNSGRQYPLRVIFWGDDHDLEAADFMNALLERGQGQLEHPLYGVKTVVPFGSISRRDDLKTNANQSIIEVTFWSTIDAVYPTGQQDADQQVRNSVTDYNSAESDALDNNIDVDTEIEKITLKNDYDRLLDSFSDGLSDVAAVTDEVQSQFETIEQSINDGIDTLVSDPLTLGFQTLQLIQAPARAVDLIEDRLDAYENLAEDITSGANAVLSPGTDSRESNRFHARDLFASGAITGMVLSSINTQFSTQTEAIEAAERLLSNLENVTDWRDDNYESLEQVDDGSAYQQLQEAVALAAGRLVEISFSLKQERSITLTRNHTIIDLVSDLYGNIDDNLDFFINTNGLTGSEIIELPKGREIVYYV